MWTLIEPQSLEIIARKDSKEAIDCIAACRRATGETVWVMTDSEFVAFLAMKQFAKKVDFDLLTDAQQVNLYNKIIKIIEA